MDIFDPKELALLHPDPDENASLETLLTKRNLPLLELFSIKNIQPKIRSNFNFFIKYCQKNEDFCFNLIDIGIKCPMHQGANDNMKQACYIAADVLTCDQDVVAQLLILPNKNKPQRKDSANDSDQFQEIQQSIETEVGDINKLQEAEAQDEQLTEQQSFNKKYKNLERLLDYIGTSQTKNLDQNCINYMIKALNCLVRKKAQEFLDFFDKKPQIFKRLIELNNFSSISQFLIKILSDDENEGARVQKVKRDIINGVWKKLKDSISHEDFIQRLDFLEQLFQTNKYASDDNRTELQKLSDVFVSRQTIQFFYSFFINPKTPAEFSNAVSYLISIAKRMNIDEEADPYSYTNEPKQQTMIFKVDVLYKEFSDILIKGYQNLVSLKYPEQYKQKIVEIKFYELLVLLTKNSRFTNCIEGKPKSEDSILKGNNIIFQSRQVKINVLKQLLRQFTKQSKNGINRISLISLIQKVLSMQVYELQNHLKTPNQEKTDKNPNQAIPSDEESKNVNCQTNSPTKQIQSSTQDDDLLDGQDKKSKINKIKAGLKLNIKKFSHDFTQLAQKEQDKKEQQPKSQILDDIKRHESTLTKIQAFNILNHFAQAVNAQSGITISEIQIKQKNRETQVGALVNKVLMILLNTIEWPKVSEDKLITQKQNFINEIQKAFPYFNFVEICKNYSVTLATTKHPNASAKEKTNPELTFTNEFFRIYQTKRQQSPVRQKENIQKTLQFSDSDFKSDEEEVQVEKCSIEDLKKFTGFVFESGKSSAKKQTEALKATHQQSTKIQVTQKIQSPKRPDTRAEQNHSSKENDNKQQSPIKIQLSPQKNSPQKPQVLEKAEQKSIFELKPAKVQGAKQNKISFEFYIKHQVILV